MSLPEIKDKHHYNAKHTCSECSLHSKEVHKSIKLNKYLCPPCLIRLLLSK